MTDLTEEVARAVWIEDARRAAPNVAKYRNAETFREQSDSDIEVWMGFAQAAIAIVLERAAEVARDKADEFNHQEAMATCDDWRSGYWTGRAESSRSILALSPNRSMEG